MKLVVLYITCILLSAHGNAQKKIIVDASGKGDFTSIQSAINSLPDTSHQARIIFIKKGTYKEKIFVTRHNIIFEGEDTKSTIITQDIARDEWRCDHEDDWGVATVNVSANDISFLNLTIANDYGFNFLEPREVLCKSDSTGRRIITNKGHQMALRSMSATRIRAVNCHFRAYAGDTVSPWNAEHGMFYFKNCMMEGGVDLYCPRGWAYAENCLIFAHTGSAAIWHDGSMNPDSKTVLKNCSFDGFKGFHLGRYHRDAQFYILDSRFSENMADKDIYLVPTDNIIQWGRRVYYHNASRAGADYSWHKNNLHAAKGSPLARDLTPDWVFNGQWKPQLENTFSFTPTTYARLKKLNSDGHYGAVLTTETMPAAHKPNNFSAQPLPYYLTEGPSWENDKVGFRLYFDQRNAKDIFGKTTPFMVLDTVGYSGDKFYHTIDPSWGMDILKVGTSLGAGALAMKIRQGNGKDTVIRLGENVGKTTYELVENSLTKAVIRLHYHQWKVMERVYDLTEEISISKGNYFYESAVTVNGLRGDEKLVTGIVNLKSKSSSVLRENGNAVLYTHDLQSENNDLLGMAIMTTSGAAPQYSEAPKEGEGITNTYMVAISPDVKGKFRFRLYACWEMTDKKFGDKKEFEKFLRKEASNWNTLSTKAALKNKAVK